MPNHVPFLGFEPLKIVCRHQNSQKNTSLGEDASCHRG